MNPYVTLVLVMIGSGAWLAGVVVYLLARGFVRPPRMTDGKALYVLGRLTPKDLGLSFEETPFRVRDARGGKERKIAAWWIPAKSASDRTVLLVHGYADAKVGAIAWAPLWHDLGHHILAIDLPAHGESDGDTCSGGFHERHDVSAVIGQLVAARPRETTSIVLFGASLGAAVVLGAAELIGNAKAVERTTEAESGRATPGVKTTNPDASALDVRIVLDSPFADFRATADAHLERLGMPGGVLRRWALRLAAWMTEADFAAVRPPDLIRRSPFPVLVLASGNDLYVTADETAEIERAIAGRSDSRFVRLEDATHLLGIVESPAEYRAAVGEFVGSEVSNLKSQISN